MLAAQRDSPAVLYNSWLVAIFLEGFYNAKIQNFEQSTKNKVLIFIVKYVRFGQLCLSLKYVDSSESS